MEGEGEEAAKNPSNGRSLRYKAILYFLLTYLPPNPRPKHKDFMIIGKELLNHFPRILW